MKTILIIEDDAAFRNSVSSLLRADFRVIGAGSAEAGLRLARQDQPDLILIDLHLPDQNGFTLCETLRTHPQTQTIPLLLITGDDSPENRVQGLDLGADDFIAKPFFPEELKARIRVQLRRSGSRLATPPPSNRSFANLMIEPQAQRALLAGKEISLTRFEYELLVYLVDRPDTLITRERLLQDLWPETKVNARTVDTHIAHLRKKLVGFEGTIKTLHRSGYLLTPGQPD